MKSTEKNGTYTKTKTTDFRCLMFSVPVGGWTDIDFPWHAAGLKFVSQSHIVSEKTVTGHFNSNNSSKH